MRHDVKSDMKNNDTTVDEVLDEIIDLEEYAKAGKTPPKARAYRIRIDKEQKVVEVPSLTGREILALVKKTPETHMLSVKSKGGPARKVQPDESVDFTTPGIERFMTLPLDPTEG
jgi:hypothetical protein